MLFFRFGITYFEMGEDHELNGIYRNNPSMNPKNATSLSALPELAPDAGVEPLDSDVLD